MSGRHFSSDRLLLLTTKIFHFKCFNSVSFLGKKNPTIPELNKALFDTNRFFFLRLRLAAKQGNQMLAQPCSHCCEVQLGSLGYPFAALYLV